MLFSRVWNTSHRGINQANPKELPKLTGQIEPQAGGSAAGLGSAAGSRGGRTRRRPGAGSEGGPSSCNGDRDEGAQRPRLQGRASETPPAGFPPPRRPRPRWLAECPPQGRARQGLRTRPASQWGFRGGNRVRVLRVPTAVTGAPIRSGADADPDGARKAG